MSRLAILYEPEAYTLDRAIMGRQSAGAAFLRAVAKAAPERVWCYARSRQRAQEMADALSRHGAGRTGTVWIPFLQPERLAAPGLLYRPDPDIGTEAWRRLARADPRAYSLCGVTHTLNTHAAGRAIADLLVAPVEGWDALVCTSRSARDVIRHILEQGAEHLRDRLGASRFTLPRMPVIPLGTHVDDFAFSADDRARARIELGVAEDEVAVLFAGRLVVHGKAHPLPMYLALEAAAEGRRVVLLQAGTAPNPEIERVFVEAAAAFCPSVRAVMVDGGDPRRYRAAWAAADLFTSLSDNHQETFGLTPVEAMAAGLPVVVSDWNGYRDTVRDGVDGFRVKTLAPGHGADLADRYDFGIDDFDFHGAHASGLVAVDVEAAAEALRRLIADPGLRARMGQAGRARARKTFDWSVVFRAYEALWEELAEARRADPRLHAPPARRRRPDRPDPFAAFGTYPTHILGPGIAFRRRDGVTLEAALARRDLDSTRHAVAVLPPPELVRAVLARVPADAWVGFEEVAVGADPRESQAFVRALVWLTKYGVLRYRAAREAAPDR